jgi:hypothetical protein
MTPSPFINPDDLHLFYEDLVCQLRNDGILCAITSGLACVHYGLAETTKDCDLLCYPDSFDHLLDLLEKTVIAMECCSYRGHISPPLDKRWHVGGWTSHFQWNTYPQITLDIFGRAVRQTSAWEIDLDGLYAGMNVVAEMKRTDRDKDWPFISSLGARMLRFGDSRGWLHLFDANALGEMQNDYTIPSEMVAIRPVLQLALNRDERLRLALKVERDFWQELDRLRIRVYRRALRPFVLAMGRAATREKLSFREQHETRVACAEKTLKENPLASYGIQRLISEARDLTAALVKPEMIQWLPNVYPHFRYLEV